MMNKHGLGRNTLIFWSPATLETVFKGKAFLLQEENSAGLMIFVGPVVGNRTPDSHVSSERHHSGVTG